MAKLERQLRGDFQKILDTLDTEILEGSIFSNFRRNK